MNFKAVIFDFNGTLFFDNDKHVLAWGKISQILRGHDVTLDELMNKINGVPNKEVVNYFLDGKASAGQMEKYSYLKEEYYRDFCRKDTDSFHLVYGAVEFFDYLKNKDIPFTIASASIKPNIDFFVESFDLDNWMNPEDIVYDDGTFSSKVKMFEKASEILDTPMKDILVIEDSYSGVQSALKAGCDKIIIIDSADQSKRFSSIPEVKYILDDFTEIIPAIEK
ncbi:MAG: HAD family phosphatase [Faecalicoccus sp.]|nr:HAD family phosphatase [Faecalicoccus sp.]